MGHNNKTKSKIRGIEKGEETQVKGKQNIVNKIKEEKFPYLKMPIKLQKAYRTPNTLYQE